VENQEYPYREFTHSHNVAGLSFRIRNWYEGNYFSHWASRCICIYYAPVSNDHQHSYSANFAPGIVLGNFIFAYLGVMPFCDALLIEAYICISIQ